MSKVRKRKIKELRGQIEALDRVMKPADSSDEWHDINAAELYQRELHEEDLRVLERLELEEQARPFGINL